MLSEFASIVEEIVRGAEELQKALVRARTDLAATAASLKSSSIAPVQAGSVLNLDQFREANARAISQALKEASGPRTGGELTGKQEAVSPAGSVLNLDQFREANARAISQALMEAKATRQVPGEEQARTAGQLADQLRKLQPDIERISRTLQEHRTKPAASAMETARSLAERPLRGGERRYRPVRERPISWGQRILQSRRGRVFRWRLERSQSPLRRYVGQALSRYAERGNARRLFLELSRAPAAMRAPQAVQQAARAGMTAQQLARGAQMVGMVGRVGGMAATAAGIATGPVGIAVMAAVAIGTAFVKAAEAVWKFVRSQDEAVHEIQRFVSNFAQVHAGFAQLQAEYQVARLQEARRMAERTYGTTALAARAAERYRREGEELRALQQNLHNLWQVGKLQLAEVTKIATGIKTLEYMAGPINNAIEAFMVWLGVDTRPKPPPFQDWLDPYRRARVQMPQRQAPAAPFNRGPKKQ
jgi:hypothetical protein